MCQLNSVGIFEGDAVGSGGQQAGRVDQKALSFAACTNALRTRRKPASGSVSCGSVFTAKVRSIFCLEFP
jgi:hypothetical protein